MLNHWTFHAEYQHSISLAVINPNAKTETDKKLPNKHHDITKIIAKQALDGKPFQFHYVKTDPK